MRALCSVRGPLGGEARALGAGARLLTLRVPAQHQPLHFVVEAKSRVKELRALANSHAQLQGMTDTELFGLAVLQNGEYWFVDLESKLSKYAPKSWRSSHTHGLDANGKPLLELHLVVQFHLESPLLLHDEVGRHFYFLQLRVNVRSRDALPAEVLLLLTGLALQAEYGDADAYEDRDYFNVEDYAPSSLTGDWVASAMRAWHREHRGLSKEDAEVRFIREVCLLPDTINSHRYRLKQSKSESDAGTVWLLVTAKGIKVLPDNGPVSTFIWSSIGKLSFDRKKFEIRTEEGKITLYSSSDDKCKYLFALCKETHQFSMKIAPKLSEIMRKEEEERKACYGYAKSLNFQYNQNKSDQRISVISTTSSNTTSGIVSDRVQSEDELEIMIDTPPAPSTESLAFAHLLDCSNSYLLSQLPKESQPLTKTSSLQLNKTKNKNRTNKKRDDNDDKSNKKDNTAEIGQKPMSQLEDSVSLPDQGTSECANDSPMSNKFKCTGSQCSSSCSTVIMARAGLALSRASDASSLELGFSHTAQNSMLSDNSTVGLDVEYSQDTASALYDGLGQPPTIAASSETSGVYTMGSSEITAQSKMDAISEASRTEYDDDSHYDCKTKENDLADFDSVSSILKSKSERTAAASMRLQAQRLMANEDCIDGATPLRLSEVDDKEGGFRERTNSSVSAVSFHGDGSDPTDSSKHNILSASELSDLIVGRGVYPKHQSISDTLDSVSDYVRLPLPFSGDSYLQGHEDTAPSDDNNPEGSFFDRPPTPPARTDSRKLLNLSLPNILDIESSIPITIPRFPDKPPPPYEYNHKTVPSFVPGPVKAPPAYPGADTSPTIPYKPICEEEVSARVVTSKPMITILKAEAGEVGASSERTFASPMVIEHRFQKSKRHQASSRRADRSKLAQSISTISQELPPRAIDSSVLVAMMKLPPPPPPRRARLPPPPPVSRLPPPPPPHNPIFHQQLHSNVDYVFYPMQDPAISQQNYLDHKMTGSRFSNMQKSSLQYRSTPFLSTSLSASSVYGSIQNLSDSYVQLPGNRTSLYSMTSRNSSISNHSIHLDRPPLPTRIPEVPHFVRTKSDENILNVRDPPPVKTRRMPPPPPPPYEHKKKLPTHLRDVKPPSSAPSEPSAKVKDANCDLDIKTLREKSKNLDLPLIAALCNDRSLLKQTKAFGAPKINKQTVSDCDSEKNFSSKSVETTTDTVVDAKVKQEGVRQAAPGGGVKKMVLRNPTDKLPALPGAEPHTPRALSNTYVMHPSVAKSKRVHPSS